MPDKPKESPRGAPDLRPQAQTDASHGTIKRPQQVDATMADKALPRGSEKETHWRK